MAIRRPPAGLLAALPSAEIIPGRATFFVRLWTPIAKGVNRIRGNGRVQPVARRCVSGPAGMSDQMGPTAPTETISRTIVRGPTRRPVR